MYVCGITVYDLCHLGHARMMVVFDMVYRWFEASGLEVTYVRNITDVDDKIINRANNEKVSSEEIANRYMFEFQQDYASLKRFNSLTY